jgi:hypothetical protein
MRQIMNSFRTPRAIADPIGMAFVDAGDGNTYRRGK